MDRAGKQLRATERGTELVKAVPDEVKSAQLTAEWETKLQQIEHGIFSANTFMSEINSFIREMCSKYGSIDSAISFSDSNLQPIGKCPKCGADVVKGKFGYYCKDKCGMNVAKVYGVSLSQSQITGLLEGRACSYTSKGKKTVVLPEVMQNNYNGKTYFQWKTERGNNNG